MLSGIVLGLMSYRSVVPPSYFSMSKDVLKQYFTSQFMALQLYARHNANASRQLSKFGILPEKYIEENVAIADTGLIREVNKCLIGSQKLDACYDKAVKLKLIPSFEDYVTYIDNAPRPAFCLPGAATDFH